MSQQFQPGDDLLFQLESGFGLLRVLAVTKQNDENIWHLLAYNELFLDIEFAEEALKNPAGLTVNIAHLAITNRAFERTPVSRLGNRAVSEVELQPYNLWKVDENHLVEDRSALQMLGLR